MTVTLHCGYQFQELQSTAFKHGDELKSTKDEIADMSRVVQRLRSEAEILKKAVSLHLQLFSVCFFIISRHVLN